MNKISFHELYKRFLEHNKANNTSDQFGDNNSLTGVIVFKQSSFQQNYTEVERSYRFTSDNKYFMPNMGGSSLYANCLDGTDNGVRLDWYFGKWKIDYCYTEE